MAGGTSAPALPTQQGRWRFGQVAVDETSAAVEVAGSAVELDRSSYDVLLTLLRHAGEVVTKAELLEAGWPGRVVSENSLAKAISRLRHALGQDAGAIRAVHGYGYRLAAAVQFQACGGMSAPPPHPAEALRNHDPLPQRPGWRLLRRLGHGGTGITFLAGSPHGELRAVKFATSEPGLRGLKREIALTRYIRAVKPELADVAQVIDWNLSIAPYFLEQPYFPEGHLADWAAARGGLDTLPIRTRLELCIHLCDAVAGLHEIGIIHKDLKPENLYPDRIGDDRWRLVLSDLGTGEAAQAPRLAELGITVTLLAEDPSSRAGSLLYFAPEVIAGEMPTQRSDVFALGVLLYQLLVGDLRRSLAPGWEADIDDELLREDIALAAAANPLRREIDAHGLAMRLRTLDERRARHEAEQREQRLAAQREHDLVRERSRRRLWLATATASALGLVGMMGLYAYAEGERRNAERNAQQRLALIEFVTQDILAQADPYQTANGGTGISVREAVERAANGVDRRFDGDPHAAAAVHELIGDVYFGQDQHARAIAQYTRARDLLASRGGEAGRSDLVRMHTELCDVYRIAHRNRDAQAACDAALAQARSEADRNFATLKLGQLLTEQDRYPQALALLEPLLDSAALRAQPKALGELYWSLGQCERGLGRYRQARRHFEALLALYRRSGERSTWTAWAYNSLGSVFVETGEYTRAEPLLSEARRIFLLTQGDGVEAQMPNVWRSEIRLRSRRWAEAKAMLEGMQAVWARTLAPSHPLRLRAEANLAWAEAMLGQRASARGRLEAAFRDRQRVFENSEGRVASRTMRWLRTALALGDLERAAWLLPLLERTLARETPFPHPMHASTDCLRGQLALARKDHAGAQRALQDCRTALLRFVDRRHPLVREADALLGRTAPAAVAQVTPPAN